MKKKWLLTPSPPRVRVVLVVFVLFLIFLSFVSTAAAQGPDNLAKIKGPVWSIGSINHAFRSNFPMDDPLWSWNQLPSGTKWLFKIENGNLSFVCFKTHCGLEVISVVNPGSSDQISYWGVVFLEDINFTVEQHVRLETAIVDYLAMAKSSPEHLTRAYKGLQAWDKSVLVQTPLVLGRISVPAIVVPTSTILIPTPVVQTVVVTTTPVPATATATATTAPTPTFLPTPMSSPMATATPRVVPTATAVAVASPTATLAVAVPLPAKPERDWGKEIGDFLVLTCSVSLIAILLIACIIGFIYWRQGQEERKQAFLQEQAESMRRHAEESALKFVQLKQKAEELLALDELTADQRNELSVVIIPSLNDLRMYHPDGEDAGAKMYLRFKQELRSKRVKK